ncbi:hypothetical protein C2E23DRAFT_867287 [Lenzites betulinus]|nr:hypothetical protein C2E23DRAFT_867287 [Lenzites betulinus]
MSQSTEQDLLAIAEMLSPNVDASRVESEAYVPEMMPVAELEPVPDMYFDEVAATTSVRDSVSSSMSSIYSSYQQRPSSGSVRSSTYTDSDGASYMGGDDLPDPAFLSPLQQHAYHGGFHLARGSLPMPPLDDSRSLSSATSYSSLRTPSLSRHSSVGYFGSPPLSPSSSYLPTPIDEPQPQFPTPPLGGKMLGVIEESLYAEDYELRRVPSEDAQTISMATPSEQSYTPAASPEPQQSLLMRKPEPRYPAQTMSSQQQQQQQQRRQPELERLRIGSQTPELGRPMHMTTIPIRQAHQNHQYQNQYNQQQQQYQQQQQEYSQQPQQQQYQQPQQQQYQQQPQQQQRQMPPPMAVPPPPAAPLSPVLSSKSSMSSGASHKGSSKVGFGKFFGRGSSDSKDKDKADARKSSASAGSVHRSDASVASFEMGNPKAEEKRLKKEAARARTERLAQDLADKARKRAEEAKAAKADRTKAKAKPTWEEGGDMYGGISYF